MENASRMEPCGTVLTLAALLMLFFLRVAGQLLVFLGTAPFLPPMSAWYSGLIPYGPLLATQILILAAGTKVIRDVAAGRGYFGTLNPHLGRGLVVFGGIYAATMVARYAITMSVYPERRWLGHGTIPVVFHLVLASFLMVLGVHHRKIAE